MVGIAFIAGIVFIAVYFFNSASGIGKNGVLWVGIALGTYLITSVFSGLIFYFLLNEYIDFMVSILIAGFLGILSLGVVNHYMNIIPD